MYNMYMYTYIYIYIYVYIGQIGIGGQVSSLDLVSSLDQLADLQGIRCNVPERQQPGRVNRQGPNQQGQQGGCGGMMMGSLMPMGSMSAGFDAMSNGGMPGTPSAPGRQQPSREARGPVRGGDLAGIGNTAGPQQAGLDLQKSMSAGNQRDQQDMTYQQLQSGGNQGEHGNSQNFPFNAEAIYIYIYIYTEREMYVYIYIYREREIYICIYIYIYAHIIYAYIYTYIYAYIYIYI